MSRSAPSDLPLILIIGLEAGVAAWLGTDIYDTSSATLRVGAIVGGAAAGISGASLVLIWAGIPRRDALAGALWAVLSWFALFASHLAWVGPLLIPLEAGVGAVAVRHRIRASVRVCVATAVVARAGAGLVRLGLNAA